MASPCHEGQTRLASYHVAAIIHLLLDIHTVLNGVAADLFPQRTGPKKATKRTRELEVRVIRMRFETTYNMYEIADELDRLGFDVSARLVGEILSDFGLSKKKLR